MLELVDRKVMNTQYLSWSFSRANENVKLGLWQFTRIANFDRTYEWRKGV